MAKVTSKMQITIPKRLAEQVGIAPGDEIQFTAAGDGIRMVPAGKRIATALSTEERLRLFRAATARQRTREKKTKVTAAPGDRGWTREELYTRGKPR
ncbi:MAG: AbrB/MazE/SpoVT family DNA-binding domain-containing protein [Gammaproteobacteria bacterium]|nr:MAG: AbrB/MazE/SpoVT family DNA-binding domain-containing protein [Gammaproteobacteria bacterium]